MIPIEIIKFKACDRNTLKGFLTVRLTNIGLEIQDIMMHKTETGNRWLNLPCRSYTKEDQTIGWNKIVSFYDKKMQRNFEREVFRILDEINERA